MANGALIMIGIPIIIGLAAGMALYAVYQSWQEEENRNQYRNRPQNISQPKYGYIRQLFIYERYILLYCLFLAHPAVQIKGEILHQLTGNKNHYIYKN